MPISVSIIIPNRNGEATIGACLEAAFESEFENFEVVVVDDFSNDRSIEIIDRFPCEIIPLAKHCGTSRARNVGAQHSRGDLLFFTDSDCLLNRNTLEMAVDSVSSAGSKVILGGTYTLRPADETFFSCFQSAFIHYSESKHAGFPDYVAAHALIIDAGEFKNSGGFAEDFLPILEDIEFSHRMRHSGFRLVINPEIQVRHIFGYSFVKSMRNAFRKSMYWTVYSIFNRDLFKDSGTSSFELKTNTLTWFLNMLFLTGYLWMENLLFIPVILLALFINLACNRHLLALFYKTGGSWFLLSAMAYYTIIYPIAVSVGSFSGLLRYRWLKKILIIND